jgi:hypothetical protein
VIDTSAKPFWKVKPVGTVQVTVEEIMTVVRATSCPVLATVMEHTVTADSTQFPTPPPPPPEAWALEKKANAPRDKRRTNRQQVRRRIFMEKHLSSEPIDVLLRKQEKLFEKRQQAGKRGSH